MSNKFDWGINTGISNSYDFKDKDVNINNNMLYMLNRSLMIFEYQGLPETLPKTVLERFLQVYGYAFIVEHKNEIYAFTGGLGGVRDVYNRPTEIVISNSALNLNKTFKLTDGVLIKNDDMMLGLTPLYSKYGSILAENEITMILANVNKRVNNLISVSDDVTGESAKAYLKKLYDGDLGYIMENKLYDSLKTNNTGNNSTVNMQELYEFHQYIKASMYNEIGLNSNFNMKRSRLVSDEVELNLDSLYPLIDNMLMQRVQGLAELKNKYDIDVEVDFSSSWDNRDIDEPVHEPIDEPTDEPKGVDVSDDEIE